MSPLIFAVLCHEESVESEFVDCGYRRTIDMEKPHIQDESTLSNTWIIDRTEGWFP